MQIDHNWLGCLYWESVWTSQSGGSKLDLWLMAVVLWRLHFRLVSCQLTIVPIMNFFMLTTTTEVDLSYKISWPWACSPLSGSQIGALMHFNFWKAERPDSVMEYVGCGVWGVCSVEVVCEWWSCWLRFLWRCLPSGGVANGWYHLMSTATLLSAFLCYYLPYLVHL